VKSGDKVVINPKFRPSHQHLRYEDRVYIIRDIINSTDPEHAYAKTLFGDDQADTRIIIIGSDTEGFFAARFILLSELSPVERALRGIPDDT
jgi:hypothetical protein